MVSLFSREGADMGALSAVDLIVFGGYFVVLIGMGLWVGRKARATSEEYFLAGRTLPWYVVGTSFIASNISTEHFIGMVGAAYTYGICVAQWEWGNIFAFSALIWFFIPFLLASRVFTAPEFLERRYNPTCRLLFALLTVVANITAFLAAVLYAAAVGLQAMFGWSIWTGVIVIAVTGGCYAIYGGLRSVAWTELFQTIIMVIGGVMVTVVGLLYLGQGHGLAAGWHTMVARNLGEGAPFAAAIERAGKEFLGGAEYRRLSVFQPMNHPILPWVTILVQWLSVSIWYNCINQFMIQRVLAAKDAWHARMGIVLAMFMKIVLPTMIVLPGLIYFAIEPGLTKQTEIDQTYAKLVTQLVNVGLRGLLLAALFGAIQSTIDSVLNSTSTIITLDIYRKFIRPQATEKQLAGMGIWLSTVILLVAVVLAPQIARLGQGVFYYIQDLYAHFAPPFAAIFVVGLLWKRATGKAAAATVIFGMVASVLLEFVVLKRLEFPVAFTLRASIVWALCVAFQVIVSLLTAPPAPENVTPDLVFDWRTTRLFADLGTPWYRNLVLWYGVAAAGMVACYVAFSGLFLK